jgi:hypothetical protein
MYSAASRIAAPMKTLATTSDGQWAPRLIRLTATTGTATSRSPTAALNHIRLSVTISTVGISSPRTMTVITT